MSTADLNKLKVRLESLSIFRGLLNDPVIRGLYDYLCCPTVFSYGEFTSRLYESGASSLSGHVKNICENSGNVYVRTAGAGKNVPRHMEQCLLAELDILQALSEITPEDLRQLLDWDGFLPGYAGEKCDIKESYIERIRNIGRYGYGIFAMHHMFYVDDQGRIVPVHHPDNTRLSDLVDYEDERQIVIDNTKALLCGKPAANILLTGDAGTGKSSTIKAVANELYTDGLRIIEVRKEQLRIIPGILDELASNPLKFILFIDDLSFSGNDDNYNALKAVLEGSVSAKSGNVIIYATSNRRHIIKEKFSDREGDDVHFNDTMQELISLSERFGIHITFQKPDKATFLHIVCKLAEQNGITMDKSELQARAEQFALRRGGRSARLAKQLIDEILSASEK